MFANLSLLKKCLFVLLAFALSAAILYGFWLLSQLGPKEIDFKNFISTSEVPETAKALKAKSLALEGQFDDVRAIREPGPEDILLLKEALDAQKAYFEALPGTDVDARLRQMELQKLFETLSARLVLEESLALQKEAEAMAAEKKLDEAKELFRKAYLKQQQINDDYPLSDAYNIGRATRLERQGRYLSAAPLLKRSLALEEEADQLMKAAQWPEAEKLLKEALALQDTLNREYRGTHQANMSRLVELGVKVVGIQSGRIYSQIQDVLERADSLRDAGQHDGAADLYAEAAQLQTELNDTYLDSPYASPERVDDYRRQSETARSFGLGRAIELNHQQMVALLSERRPDDAVKVLEDLRRDVTLMERRFPRSALNDEDLQLKVRYLYLIQGNLRAIQDQVFDSLLPVPESKDWRMLRTEVPQNLYALAMGTNPSRNPGDRRPVDSVNWHDATQFCQRLSWILEKSVRLPTEDEFRKALGPLRFLVLEDYVWSLANAEGVPQPVGSKTAYSSGFHDLLGNVSEWLQSEDRGDLDRAIRAGGHAQDRLDQIFKVPMREYLRRERNRMTGFRVVVKVD